MRLMLTTGTKYDSIDWGSLKQGYGPADDLPPILMDLTDPEKAEGAIEHLWMGPFYENTLYSSTGLVMAIAARFLAQGKCSRPEELSTLLFAFANLVEIYSQASDDLDDEMRAVVASCQVALADSAEFLLPCVGGDGPIARTAIGFQKYHPCRAEEAVPALRQRLLANDDDIALFCAWMLGHLGVVLPAGVPADSTREESYLLGSAFGGHYPAEKTVDLARNWALWIPILELLSGDEGIGEWLARVNPQAATYFLGAALPRDRTIFHGLTLVARTSRQWGPMAVEAIVTHVMNPQCCIDPTDLIGSLRQLLPNERVCDALIVAAQRYETAGPWPIRADVRAYVVMSLVEAGDPRWEDVLEKFIRGTHPHKSYTVNIGLSSVQAFHGLFHQVNPQPSQRIVAAAIDAVTAGDKNARELLLLISQWPRDICIDAIPLARQRLPEDLHMLTVLARWGDKEGLPLIEEKLKGVELNESQQRALSVLRGDSDSIDIDTRWKNASRQGDVDELYTHVFSEKEGDPLPAWEAHSLLTSAAEYVDLTGRWPGTAEYFIDLIRLGCANDHPLDAIALAEKAPVLAPEIQREVAGLLREEIAKDRRLPSIGFAAVDDEIFLSRARVLLAQLENN
ncbi:MAG: hypothetical protein Q4C87_04200 [Actinomycetaceae bacterium]|nr:hypothetical protein [Actinomycetaceae bacterium]